MYRVHTSTYQVHTNTYYLHTCMNSVQTSTYQVHTSTYYLPLVQFILGGRHEEIEEGYQPPKKGINRQALRRSSLCLRRFSTSSSLSLTRPTSWSSSSSNSSRAASSCSIACTILRCLHSQLCPSATGSSLSGHQHVAHDSAEQRQFTSTSAPSMLRESE
jgi:hypothetical protein